MSGTVEIRRGGRLFESRWSRRVRRYVARDVTNSSFRHLFDSCDIEDGVRLVDILRLVGRQVDVFDAVFGNHCRELVREGLRRTRRGRDGNIDFLELYWGADLDEEKLRRGKKTTLQGMLFPSFHGVGPVEPKDKIEHGSVVCRKGDRERWAIDLTPVSHLASLPVRMSESLEIYPPLDPKKYPEPPLLRVDVVKPSFGQVIQGILWELSFHGAPRERDDMAAKLRVMVSEIMATGEADGGPGKE